MGPSKLAKLRKISHRVCQGAKEKEAASRRREFSAHFPSLLGLLQTRIPQADLHRVTILPDVCFMAFWHLTISDFSIYYYVSCRVASEKLLPLKSAFAGTCQVPQPRGAGSIRAGAARCMPLFSGAQRTCMPMLLQGSAASGNSVPGQSATFETETCLVFLACSLDGFA